MLQGPMRASTGDEAVRNSGFHRIETQRLVSFHRRFKGIQGGFSRRNRTMKKLAILVTTILLLAGTGLAQRKSQESIDLATPDASRAVYLKATACRNIFDPNDPRSIHSRDRIEALSVDVWADQVGLGLEGVDPFTFQVMVDLVSGETDVPVGEIAMENGVGFLSYYVRINPLFKTPLRGAQNPVPPAPYRIKTVKLMCNGELMAEGSF